MQSKSRTRALDTSTPILKNAICGPFVMELAGLEPATSWVRSSHTATLTKRMVEPFGRARQRAPTLSPQHFVARSPLRQEFRTRSAPMRSHVPRRVCLARRSPPIRSDSCIGSQTSDGPVRGGPDSHNNDPARGIICTGNTIVGDRGLHDQQSSEVAATRTTSGCSGGQVSEAGVAALG
jgi:hypothetical protein